MNPPLVSVLMGARNAAPWVREAVESLQGQTLGDFELLAVDDGSDDATWEILLALAREDRRIVPMRHESPLGLAAALNRGLDAARGVYLARQDADDLSLPRRFAEQVAFLERHPEVGLLGTPCLRIDEAGTALPPPTTPPPLDDAAIRWMLLLRNPFVHTSVMMRREVLAAHDLRYDASLPLSQDIELWPRLLAFARGANLAEPLVRHRIHDQRVSARQSDAQQLVGYAIRQRGLEALIPGCVSNPDEVKRLQALSWVVPACVGKEELAAGALLLRLFRAQRDGMGSAALAPRPEEARRVERQLVDHLLHFMRKTRWSDVASSSLPAQLLRYHPAALGDQVAKRGLAWLRRRLFPLSTNTPNTH